MSKLIKLHTGKYRYWEEVYATLAQTGLPAYQYNDCSALHMDWTSAKCICLNYSAATNRRPWFTHGFWDTVTGYQYDRIHGFYYPINARFWRNLPRTIVQSYHPFLPQHAMRNPFHVTLVWKRWLSAIWKSWRPLSISWLHASFLWDDMHGSTSSISLPLPGIATHNIVNIKGRNQYTYELGTIFTLR